MVHEEDKKVDAISMLEEGVKVKEISELLGIPISTIYRWRKEPDPKPQQAVAGGDEMLHLRQLVYSYNDRIKELEAYIAKIERAKVKEQDYEDSPTTLLFKRK